MRTHRNHKYYDFFTFFTFLFIYFLMKIIDKREEMVIYASSDTILGVVVDAEICRGDDGGVFLDKFSGC